MHSWLVQYMGTIFLPYISCLELLTSKSLCTYLQLCYFRITFLKKVCELLRLSHFTRFDISIYTLEAPIGETELRDIQIVTQNSRGQMDPFALEFLDFVYLWSGWGCFHVWDKRLYVTSQLCPLVLDANAFWCGPSPFRFEIMWL